MSRLSSGGRSPCDARTDAHADANARTHARTHARAANKGPVRREVCVQRTQRSNQRLLFLRRLGVGGFEKLDKRGEDVQAAACRGGSRWGGVRARVAARSVAGSAACLFTT